MEDEHGVPVGIFGIEWDEFQAKQLRAICSKLNVKGARNAKKQDMVEYISKSYKNKRAYDALKSQQENSKPPPREGREKNVRKQIQCPFRLMNIIFSDDFIEDFATLGNVASRQLLDSGKAGNQQHFWERVSSAFATPELAYGMLQFPDDDIMACNSHIDPSRIVPHDWTKLRAMWKSINADYKAALNKFTQSGTHSNDFYAFCNGKVETYYLRKHLELRPNINATVEAALPEECALATDGAITSSSTVNTRKTKRGNSEIVEAIRELNNNTIEVEVARQKIACMEKEEERRQVDEVRRQQEETRRENEETRRQREELRLQDEHAQKKQRNMLEEWERMRSNIRTLRKDLEDTSLNNDAKLDIETDIKALLKRKKALAVELGYN